MSRFAATFVAMMMKAVICKSRSNYQLTYAVSIERAHIDNYNIIVTIIVIVIVTNAATKFRLARIGGADHVIECLYVYLFAINLSAV